MVLEVASTILNFLVLLVGTVYGVWSWLTHGFTRQIYDAVKRVPEMADKQDQMCKRQSDIRNTQEDLTHAVSLLAYSRRHDGVEINEQALLDDLNTSEWNRYIEFDDPRGRAGQNTDD